jgi:transporter family protein
MSWFIFALLTAFLSSLAALFEKRALNRLHSIDFSAGIAFTTAFLTLPILFTASWEMVSVKALVLMFLLSFMAAWGFLNVTRGVRHMEISLSAPLFLLGPLITTIFAFIILGEKISLLQMAGMLVLMFGAYVLETKHVLEGGEFLQNIWGNKYSRYIIFGLLLYGLTSVGDRVVVGLWNVPVPLYTAIIQLFIAVQFLFLTWKFRGSPLASMRLVQKYWVSILVLAILTIGYRMTYGFAIAVATSVGLVVAIKRTASLFATIIGGELFHDHGVLRKSIACIIMMVGVLLIAI